MLKFLPDDRKAHFRELIRQDIQMVQNLLHEDEHAQMFPKDMSHA